MLYKGWHTLNFLFMDQITTLKKYAGRIITLLLFFISVEGFSQPDYSFSGGTLTSGTALTVGANYLFTAVRPGVDAVLSITAMSPGIGLTELDGTSGYPATIQPTITAN